MATIQERRTESGDLRYRVLVRLKGAPTQTATFARLADARRWAQKTETAIREDRYFETSEARKHTVAELIDRYVRDVLDERPAGRTQDNRRHLAWWRSQLGAYTLADLKPAMIVEQRDRLRRETTNRGRRRAPGTVNRYLTSFAHALSVAEREWGWVQVNPARKVSKLREPRGRVRFLTDEERPRLLEACRESDDPRLYPLVLLALSTGARAGELMKLRWQDVDFERRRAILHDTKNRERRAIPLEGLAHDVLADFGKVRRLGTDRVFAAPSDKATFPRAAWDRALESAEIEDFRFHDCRHSAASYLAMNGATLAEIAAVLGHKTLAMVKRYSHLTEQHTAGVVARMNAKVFGQSHS